MGFAEKFIEQASAALSLCDDRLIAKAGEANPWFCPLFVKHRLNALKQSLEQDKSLLVQLLDFEVPATAPRLITIVAAGNIPLVCWHDLVCALAYASAHPDGVTLEVKLSSKDNVLLPAIVDRLYNMENSCLKGIRIRFVSRADPGTRAILFTGGSNAEAYYRQAFPGIPVLIRTGRSSVAVLDGTESEEELEGLVRDCFLYFGLGCRNVSLLMVPFEYDFLPFVQKTATVMGPVLSSHKNYMSALRHARACALMLKDPAGQENPYPEDFFVLEESEGLNPPVAVVHYTKYNKREDISFFLEKNRDLIQCVAGTGEVPLGKTQFPAFTDYADRLNTLEWLQKLSY
ncbi:MAG TPA: hypothetical protein PLS52_02275 [Bacteroidales bacterium]|nr:hypothetical protein [Bacteroidales bacterium]HPQ55938.1 hypothetical protein [Bacteroidales bacterium]